MKVVELSPVRQNPADWDLLEALISRFFREQIYFPLLEALDSPKHVLNSVDALYDAIMSGRVYFYRGAFTGKFSAAISKALYKMGAVRDTKQGSFRIPLSKLPIGVRQAISLADDRLKRIYSEIDDRLASMTPEEFITRLDSQHQLEKVITRTDKELIGTLRAITVQPEVSKEMRSKIAAEYANNMDKYIVDWTKKEIKDLRSAMQKNFYEGKRYETIVETIERSYGVSRSKAKFLARQETSLMTAKFKEAKYADAGIDEYTWHCVVGSPHHPVRPRHKALDEMSKKGMIFRFSNPPVTTEPGQPERRNNPTEDFNCRCFARPVVRFRS